jgi:hypothetical protein
MKKNGITITTGYKRKDGKEITKEHVVYPEDIAAYREEIRTLLKAKGYDPDYSNYQADLLPDKEMAYMMCHYPKCSVYVDTITLYD